MLELIGPLAIGVGVLIVGLKLIRRILVGDRPVFVPIGGHRLVGRMPVKLVDATFRETFRATVLDIGRVHRGPDEVDGYQLTAEVSGLAATGFSSERMGVLPNVFNGLPWLEEWITKLDAGVPLASNLFPVKRVFVQFDVEGARIECKVSRSDSIDDLGFTVERTLSDREGMAEALEGMAREAAFRYVINCAKYPFRGSSISLSTTDWKALQLLTDALRVPYRSGTYRTLGELQEDEAHEMSTLLQRAVETDGGSPLCKYNLAVLHAHWLRYRTDNKRAIQLFRETIEDARRLREECRADWSLEQRMTALLVDGLRNLANSLAQQVHRFGVGCELEAQRLREQAVRAAAEALELRPDDPHVLYSMAFASHCTETLDAIEEGITWYARVTEHPQHHGRYPQVHNNLGYILMKKGFLLMYRQEGHPAKAAAETAWRRAERELRFVIDNWDENVSSRRYAEANSANLLRLRGKLDDAVAEYESLSKRHPEYIEARNELACAYLHRSLAHRSPAQAGRSEADLRSFFEQHEAVLRGVRDLQRAHKLAARAPNTLQCVDRLAAQELEGVLRRLCTERSLDTGAFCRRWLDALATRLSGAATTQAEWKHEKDDHAATSDSHRDRTPDTDSLGVLDQS